MADDQPDPEPPPHPTAPASPRGVVNFQNPDWIVAVATAIQTFVVAVAAIIALVGYLDHRGERATNERTAAQALYDSRTDKEVSAIEHLVAFLNFVCQPKPSGDQDCSLMFNENYNKGLLNKDTYERHVIIAALFDRVANCIDDGRCDRQVARRRFCLDALHFHVVAQGLRQFGGQSLGYIGLEPEAARTFANSCAQEYGTMILPPRPNDDAPTARSPAVPPASESGSHGQSGDQSDQ